jgi:glutaredoxin
LQAWAESLGGISYPLLSDFWPHGAVAKRYGVLRDEGDAERAIFIIDRWGMIRYIDIHDIDEQPDNEVLFAELAKVDPGISAKRSVQRPAEDEELPKGGVVLYCTRWCPACVKARKWFEMHGIEYVEVNVSVNQKAAEQVMEWAGGNRVTPTLDIHGTILVGWDEAEAAKLLLDEN